MKQLLEYNPDITNPPSRWQIVSAHPTAKSKLLYIQEAGEFFAGDSYYTTRQGVSSFLLKLTVSGRGILQYADKEYTVGQNELFLIDCKPYQHYETDSEIGNWRMLWVHFKGATAAAYYDIFKQLNDNNPTLRLKSSDDMKGILERLLVINTDENNSLEADVETSRLLTELLTLCIAHAGTRREREPVPAFVDFLREHINEFYAEPLTLDTLALRCSVSKYHMQRLFKRHMGQTPAEYLRGVRIAKAKELLRTSSVSVDEIAYLVGIENVSHFINTFKKQVGTTPNRFRKSWMNYGG